MVWDFISVTPGLNNGTNSEQQCTGQVLCSQQCEALHKIALKLHQIECGQRKIIQLLLNLDKELSAKEKSGSHCSKHSRLFKRSLRFYL